MALSRVGWLDRNHFADLKTLQPLSPSCRLAFPMAWTWRNLNIVRIPCIARDRGTASERFRRIKATTTLSKRCRELGADVRLIVAGKGDREICRGVEREGRRPSGGLSGFVPLPDFSKPWMCWLCLPGRTVWDRVAGSDGPAGVPSWQPTGGGPLEIMMSGFHGILQFHLRNPEALAHGIPLPCDRPMETEMDIPDRRPHTTLKKISISGRVDPRN